MGWGIIRPWAGVVAGSGNYAANHDLCDLGNTEETRKDGHEPCTRKAEFTITDDGIEDEMKFCRECGELYVKLFGGKLKPIEEPPP